MTLIAEEIVGSLPGNGLAGSDEDLGEISFPVIRLEIVEVVALVHAGEAPVETGLVFVMTGAEFGEFPFSIRGDDGVEVWASGRAGDLSENGGVTAANGDEFSLGVVVESQVVCGHNGG